MAAHAHKPIRGFAGRTLAALALLAMTVRALVPAGFMVAPGEPSHLVTIELCTAQAATPILIDLATGRAVTPDEAPAGPPRMRDAPCLFAAAPILPPPEPMAPRPHRLAAMPDAPIRKGSRDLATALAAPPPWATGPPVYLGADHRTRAPDRAPNPIARACSCLRQA